MSSTEAPISITVKTPAGSLVTVRAETGETLDQLVANALASITSAVQELENAVRSNATATTAAINAINKQFSTTPIAAPEPPPYNVTSIMGGRSCAHGKMTAMQGPSKNGGVYKGYFCPSAQGDPTKCKNIYITKTDPEWNTFVADKIK